MSNTTNAQAERGKPMRLGLRLLIAIPMALIFLGIGIAIYMPLAFVGGMATDSCSGSLVYSLWEIWLLVLWASVLLVSALVPPVLIALGRQWRWVLLTIIVGAMVSVVWYILWYAIVMVTC